jgi:hypothetical protein
MDLMIDDHAGNGGGDGWQLHCRQPFFLQEVAEGLGGTLGEPTGPPLADRFG